MGLQNSLTLADYFGESVNRMIDGTTDSTFVRPNDLQLPESNGAIVLGNGITRAYPEHEKLLMLNSRRLSYSYKTVYGCNRAIYDSFACDFYVIKDKAFLSNIPAARKASVFLPNNLYLEMADSTYNMLPMVGYLDSGSSAAMLAAFHGHKHVFLIGFDGNLGAGYQTVYDEHWPYNQQTVDSPFNALIMHMAEVLAAYPDVQFYRIQSDGEPCPKQWTNIGNIRDVSLRQAVLLGDF